jgi:hypothetical protein
MQKKHSNMRIVKLILIVLLPLILSFTLNSDLSEKTKYEMFVKAIDDNSTAPYYVVIKVKDMKTGLEKEICTEAPFLSGAIYREWNCGIFQSDSIAKTHKDRYFEFSKDSALWNISFDLYSSKDLADYKSKINIDTVIKDIKSGKIMEKTFLDKIDRLKNQRMFSHLLINQGIMVRRGCIAGNIISFEEFK